MSFTMTPENIAKHVAETRDMAAMFELTSKFVRSCGYNKEETRWSKAYSVLTMCGDRAGLNGDYWIGAGALLTMMAGSDKPVLDVLDAAAAKERGRHQSR